MKLASLSMVSLIACLQMTDVAEAKQRELTIDDVLAIERVDEVVPSPVGSATAIVVQRPATDGLLRAAAGQPPVL